MNVPLAATELGGYVQNRQDRNSHGSWICTYVKTTLKPKVSEDWQARITKLDVEMTTEIELRENACSILIFGDYRPPNAKKEWFEALNEVITEALSRGKLIIITGDLNADLMRPSVNPGKMLKQSLTLAGTKIKETTDSGN